MENINEISVKNPFIIPEVNLASRSMVAGYLGVTPTTIGNMVKKYSDELVALGMRNYNEEELIGMGFVKKTRTRFKKDNALVQLESGNGTVTLLNVDCIKFIAGKLTNSTVAKDIMDAVTTAAAVQEETATDEVVEVNNEQFQVFNNPEFGNIRMIVMDGAPWFVGKDVADALQYSNSRKALLDHVDNLDKNTVTNRDGNRGNPKMTIINESGFYALVMRSKLPEAIKFQRWVTSEVLPSIRRHGAYMTTETLMEAMKNPDYVIELVRNLSEEQQKRIELEKKNSILETTNQVLVHENLTWGDREILNRIVRKTACWFYPGVDMAKAVRYMWASIYKDVLYKHHINLKGRLEKATPEELAKAVSVAAAKCLDVDIDLAEIIGFTNAQRATKLAETT